MKPDACSDCQDRSINGKFKERESQGAQNEYKVNVERLQPQSECLQEL